MTKLVAFKYVIECITNFRFKYLLNMLDCSLKPSRLFIKCFHLDTSLPVITFDKPDPKKPEKDLSVTWKSSEDADFECALDSPFDYKKCGNGKTGAFQKDDLPDGEHKLYVRGKDDVGNVGKPSVYTVTTGITQLYVYLSRPIPICPPPPFPFKGYY